MLEAALLLMFFQFTSANGQTVDTQCVRTGPVFSCQSKLDEKSKSTNRGSQETWNRIDENLRRADDAEDRIRRSQQRIDQAEENSKEIYSAGFCVILEMILREWTATKKDGKVWILDPEQTMYNNIENYHF
jgi:hypothetical protein